MGYKELKKRADEAARRAHALRLEGKSFEAAEYDREEDVLSARMRNADPVAWQRDVERTGLVRRLLRGG